MSVERIGAARNLDIEFGVQSAAPHAPDKISKAMSLRRPWKILH